MKSINIYDRSIDNKMHMYIKSCVAKFDIYSFRKICVGNDNKM